MTIEQEIVKIILTPGVNNLHRVVKIFHFCKGDATKLAETLDIDLRIIKEMIEIPDSDFEPVDIADLKLEPATSFKEYLAEFRSLYATMTQGVEFSFLKKDYPCLANLMKEVNIEKLREFFAYLTYWFAVKKEEAIDKIPQKKSKVPWTTWSLVGRISPGTLLSNMNYLNTEVVGFAPAAAKKKMNFENFDVGRA